MKKKFTIGRKVYVVYFGPDLLPCIYEGKIVETLNNADKFITVAKENKEYLYNINSTKVFTVKKEATERLKELLTRTRYYRAESFKKAIQEVYRRKRDIDEIDKMIKNIGKS